MKIRLNDRVEIAYTSFVGLDPEAVSEQPGLRILSEVAIPANGVDAIAYVLLGDKGAVVTVPKRLGRRLVEIGCADKAEN